jgi:hypothetical protein
MDNPQSSTHTSSRPRNRTITRSVPVPQTQAERTELRELLETHLQAMQALLEEHQRTLDRSLRAADGSSPELLAELRALADHRAPWVQAAEETRALLFVALREVIVGTNDAGVSIRFSAMPQND